MCVTTILIFVWNELELVIHMTYMHEGSWFSFAKSILLLVYTIFKKLQQSFRTYIYAMNSYKNDTMWKFKSSRIPTHIVY